MRRATLLAIGLCCRVAADGGSSAIGFIGRDFVILAADTAFRRGTQVISPDSQRVHSIGPRTILAAVGDVGGAKEFATYIAGNVALQEIVHGRPVSTQEAAHFTRHEIARLLRRAPVQADVLIAGIEDSQRSIEGRQAKCRPQLHWIDRAGSWCELDYAAQGPSAAMAIATLDSRWRKDMDVGEALELVRICLRQLQGRYALTPQGWRVNIVDAAGSRVALIIKAGGEEEIVEGIMSEPRCADAENR